MAKGLKIIHVDGNLKLWIGRIPEIYGYGVMVIELTEDEARKSLKKAFAEAKKYNDGQRGYAASFEHWGGRIFEVETGKHYGDDFTQ
jgi:ABC-type phosphate/phosphonate transport system substrate-binding protein